MKTCSILLLFTQLICAPHGHTDGINTNKPAVSPTNSMDLNLRIVDGITLLKHDPNMDLWPALDDMIAYKGNISGNNRLGYMNMVRLIRDQNRLGYNFTEKYNRIGTKVFIDTLGDSAREIFVAVTPIDAIGEETESRIVGFIGSVFRSSVGNTEEEDLNSISATPQATGLEQKWWLTKNDNGLLDTGWKPFRETPYVYATFGIGHINHKPALLNVRLYSMLFDRQVGNPRFDLNMIIPCSQLSQIVIGGSLYPASMQVEDRQPRASIRYERALFKDTKSKFFSVGVQTGHEETLALATFSVRL